MSKILTPTGWKLLYEELNISSDQKNAIKAYTGNKSEEINNNRDHPAAKHLDDVIKANPNPRKRHVLTGVHYDPRKKVRNGYLRTRGFLSTTDEKTPENAYAFANRKTSTTAKSVVFKKGTRLHTRGPKHIMRITLPKGSGATDISPHSTNGHENETLIHRGSKLKYFHTTSAWNPDVEAHYHTHHFELENSMNLNEVYYTYAYLVLDKGGKPYHKNDQVVFIQNKVEAEKIAKQIGGTVKRQRY